MTTGPRSQCSACLHFRSWSQRTDGGDAAFCAAFDPIPDPILYGALDHRQPIQGDHGVRWESNGQPFPEASLAS